MLWKVCKYISESLQKIGNVSFTYNFVDAVTTAIEKTNDEHTLLFLLHVPALIICQL